MASTATNPIATADAAGSLRGTDAGARFRPISNPATGKWIQFTTLPEGGDVCLH
jgi:hypothetical protein